MKKSKKIKVHFIVLKKFQKIAKKKIIKKLNNKSKKKYNIKK